MKVVRGSWLFCGLVASACAPQARVADPARPAARTVGAIDSAALEQRIRERVARDTGITAGVVVIDFASGLRIAVNAHESMHAASTMKVPVLLEVFRQAEAGRLALDDSVPIVTSFRSIVGDTSYSLTPASDSDSTLYARAGGRTTIRELARVMIVRSSNLATNILIDRVGATSVMATLNRIGAAGMVVRRGVEDGPAYRRGLNNTATAHGFAATLEAIARCTVTTQPSCDEMTGILAAQEFNETIPAGLPPGTRVAHKTGWITAIHHDGAIVYPPGRAPYILVVMTRGSSERNRAIRLGADVSRIVWGALTGR